MNCVQRSGQGVPVIVLYERVPVSLPRQTIIDLVRLVLYGGGGLAKCIMLNWSVIIKLYSTPTGGIWWYLVN